MKLLLKLLLSLCVLIASIYASTPLWLPYILAGQLPPGWQLEKLETDYPGFSGVHFKALRVSGKLQAATLELTATDFRFSYRGLKTEIGSLTLDVFFLATGESTADALTLENLSLPIAKLTGKLPDLSVNQLRVVLHPPTGIEPVNTGAIWPLVLEFQELKLLPGTDNSFHLTTVASNEVVSGVAGRLNVDVSTNSRRAEIRFPVNMNSLAWLAVSLEQKDHTAETTTRLQVTFDAEQANQEWLDIILRQGTNGFLNHVTGKLNVRADFAGSQNQGIEFLSLATEQLQAEFEDGILILKTELQASRESEKVMITLPGPADIQYRDKTGKINALLLSAIPGLQRTSQPFATAHAILDTSSSFIMNAGPDPSIQFNGDIKLKLASTDSSVHLQATDFQIENEGFSSLNTMTANGLLTINWEEIAALSYSSDGLGLEVDKLSLTSTGQLQIANQSIDFKQVGEVTLQNPVIRLPAGEAPPATITASKLSITAELTSHNEELVSSGDAVFWDGHIAPLDTSTNEIEITWQDLDLLKLAGKLSTRTLGFSTQFDGETWAGFDFDVNYSLLGNDDINGSGILKFDAGPELPIEFAGNTQVQHWDIKLLPATIQLSQLGELLRVARYKLPKSVKLTDGYINLQGDVVADDAISAKMTIKGHGLGASMQESSASKVDFTFNTGYANTISASGPLSIETVTLAGGIDVSQITLDLNLENKDTFGLKNLHAEVFDGQLSLNSLRFSETRIEDTTIELKHINLGHILAFADIDGLEGTGFLEISLPVGSDQTGVYVKNGTFKSAGAGHLAYTKEGMAGSNIGLQALENFQYQDLSGTINYQSDGDYQVNIHLEGNNPDLYGGHPIVFNLNINGSLPELFEAMFMTGSFEESILKQIRTDSSE